MTDIEFESSIIGKDFLDAEREGNPQPNSDQILDWINHLKQEIPKKEYPEDWYEREIQASFEILKRLEQ